MADQVQAAALAQAFHEAYERLAPNWGYQTREASAKPWVEVPENNRGLMTAVCAEMLDGLVARAVQVAILREMADEMLGSGDGATVWWAHHLRDRADRIERGEEVMQ